MQFELVVLDHKGKKIEVFSKSIQADLDVRWEENIRMDPKDICVKMELFGSGEGYLKSPYKCCI